MIRCYVPRCHGNQVPVPGGQHATYSWAHASCCTRCQRIGYVCMESCTLRKAMETRRQLRDHHYTQHFEQTSAAVVEYPVETTCDASEDMDAINIPPEVPLIVLHSTALQTFLNRSINEGMVMAIRHLVCGACFSTSRLPIPVIQTILLQDTYIVLLLARLVFRIGSVHNVLLSTLLSVFVISRPSPGPSALPITRSQA
jgi:hypothetical protein